MSRSTKTIRAEGSKASPALAVSDWPMSRPLFMRSRLSSVIAWRGSFGSDQAAIGAGPCMDIRPWRTRMPSSALVTDLVIDQPMISLSTP